MSQLDQSIIRALTPSAPSRSAPGRSQPTTAGQPQPPAPPAANPPRELYVWNRQGVAPRPKGRESAAHLAGPHFPTDRGPAAARAAIKPAWEVDAVRWPDLCRRLELELDEALGTLADRLMELAARQRTVVGITGLHRGEGRTTLLLSIARQLAWKAPEFAVLDADWHRPSLCKQLGVTCEAGWEQVLKGSATLDEICIRSHRDHLLLVPLAQPMPRPLTPLQHQQLGELLARLTASCPLVLVDLGPIGASVHQLVPCDQMLVVHDRRAGGPAEVARLLDKLQFAGIATLGVVENFAPGAQEDALGAGAE